MIPVSVFDFSTRKEVLIYNAELGLLITNIFFVLTMVYNVKSVQDL